ncbi:MAG: hypothetical protein IPP13_14265 [Kouleothrix sp.]|jgi:hypothetical protein|nr:hypothetical protein [Kouleothrix sp.]
MSGKVVAFYRLPIASSAKIGQIRIVKDRNGVCYADGSKVLSANITGAHSVLTLADGRNYYVLTAELQRVPNAKAKR